MSASSKYGDRLEPEKNIAPIPQSDQPGYESRKYTAPTAIMTTRNSGYRLWPSRCVCILLIGCSLVLCVAAACMELTRSSLQGQDKSWWSTLTSMMTTKERDPAHDDIGLSGGHPVGSEVDLDTETNGSNDIINYENIYRLNQEFAAGRDTSRRASRRRGPIAFMHQGDEGVAYDKGLWKKTEDLQTQHEPGYKQLKQMHEKLPHLDQLYTGRHDAKQHNKLSSPHSSDVVINISNEKSINVTRHDLPGDGITKDVGNDDSVNDTKYDVAYNSLLLKDVGNSRNELGLTANQDRKNQRNENKPDVVKEALLGPLGQRQPSVAPSSQNEPWSDGRRENTPTLDKEESAPRRGDDTDDVHENQDYFNNFFDNGNHETSYAGEDENDARKQLPFRLPTHFRIRKPGRRLHPSVSNKKIGLVKNNQHIVTDGLSHSQTNRKERNEQRMSGRPDAIESFSGQLNDVATKNDNFSSFDEGNKVDHLRGNKRLLPSSSSKKKHADSHIAIRNDVGLIPTQKPNTYLSLQGRFPVEASFEKHPSPEIEFQQKEAKADKSFESKIGRNTLWKNTRAKEGSDTELTSEIYHQNDHEKVERDRASGVDLQRDVQQFHQYESNPNNSETYGRQVESFDGRARNSNNEDDDYEEDEHTNDDKYDNDADEHHNENDFAQDTRGIYMTHSYDQHDIEERQRSSKDAKDDDEAELEKLSKGNIFQIKDSNNNIEPIRTNSKVMQFDEPERTYDGKSSHKQHDNASFSYSAKTGSAASSKQEKKSLELKHLLREKNEQSGEHAYSDKFASKQPQRQKELLDPKRKQDQQRQISQVHHQQAQRYKKREQWHQQQAQLQKGKVLQQLQPQKLQQLHRSEPQQLQQQREQQQLQQLLLQQQPDKLLETARPVERRRRGALMSKLSNKELLNLNEHNHLQNEDVAKVVASRRRQKKIGQRWSSDDQQVYQRERRADPMEVQKKFLIALSQATMIDAEQAARKVTAQDISRMIGDTGDGGVRAQLTSEQKTFVVCVVVLLLIIGLTVLVFAFIWCLYDAEFFCPLKCPDWCVKYKIISTPKDSFSPQRWWMDLSLARRVELLEMQPDAVTIEKKKKRRRKSEDGTTRDFDAAADTFTKKRARPQTADAARAAKRWTLDNATELCPKPMILQHREIFLMQDPLMEFLWDHRFEADDEMKLR